MATINIRDVLPIVLPDIEIISGKVDKITGYSLVPNTEIVKLAGIPKITVSATEPINPQEGDLWIDIS